MICLPVTFKETNRLAKHLLLDFDTRTLYVFHHTTFLKAHLDRFERERDLEENSICRPVLECSYRKTASPQPRPAEPHFPRLGEGSWVAVERTHDNLRGRLPPQLLVETLHSIQSILFHFDDQRSRKILERLIRKVSTETAPSTRATRCSAMTFTLFSTITGAGV